MTTNLTADGTRGAAHVREWTEAVLDELENAVVGKRDVLELVLAGILANGHILLEDVPGVAKTLLARSIAQVSRLEFNRIQFTPDLVPADITGSSVLDRVENRSRFEPGPIFANLVLGDEINRAPPKTQAAVLEAMEERQVTSDGVTRPLPEPFIVIATQNPLESEGTYPLPEAQLDRFLLKTAIGYPSRADEIDIVLRRAARGRPQVELREMLDAATLVGLQKIVEGIHVDSDVAAYMVDLVLATRASARTDAGASPRGSLALLSLSRARAAIRGRDFVIPSDVAAVAVAALSHRILLRSDQWVQGVTGEIVVAECLRSVPAPPTTDDHPAA